MKKNVRIRIRAAVTDLVLAERYQNTAHDGFFTSDEGKTLPVASVTEAASQIITYTVYGCYTREDGVVTICYTEPSEVGYENCITSLIFRPEEKEVLTMAATAKSLKESVPNLEELFANEPILVRKGNFLWQKLNQVKQMM